MALRNRLPSHHLDDASRGLLQIGLGIVGTMAGLVLGLLVSSATGSYNTQRGEVLEVASKVVLLDRILAHYGPAANPQRRALRVGVQRALEDIWPKDAAKGPKLDPLATHGEALFDEIERLAPHSDNQRGLKGDAISLAIALGQTRWLMFEQSGSALSMPLLVLLIFWFTITFVGFGLFSPSNATVLVALGLCALAVSGAIFVTVEMSTPFEGLMRIPSTPLQEALTNLGR
ncbi:MAG: hypothetical protein JO104_08305 [Candidatus Eremiobacteraeota bacterium]|nr:hypothetical protein [Candidatus Eremiobacteraeota bacterium]